MTASELMQTALTMRTSAGASRTIDEMRAEAYNRTLGNLSEIDCPICLNKGYVARCNGFFALEECSCIPKRKSLLRLKKSGLNEMFEIYTFDKWEASESWQKEIKQKAVDYVSNGDGKWFLATGTPGTGKTHICTAICKELIEQGKEVRYMLWRQEAPKLKALVNDRGEYEKLMYKYMTVDVLYIDDFFKGGITEADVNLAFELLNARYNATKLRTIISSEKIIGQILDIDEAIGSRIFQRSKGYQVKTEPKNYRLRGG